MVEERVPDVVEANKRREGAGEGGEHRSLRRATLKCSAKDVVWPLGSKANKAQEAGDGTRAGHNVKERECVWCV